MIIVWIRQKLSFEKLRLEVTGDDRIENSPYRSTRKLCDGDGTRK